MILWQPDYSAYNYTYSPAKETGVTHMALSNTKITSIRPGDRPIKVTDEKGLFLLVNPNGSMYWRVRYRLAGREKSLSLGIYPSVSLKEARAERDAIRSMLASGIDPSANRKLEKAAELASLTTAIRFLLDSNGALSFALGKRHLSLSREETLELRLFLDATKGVANGTD